MTQTEISNFLQAGALFGGADGQCVLFLGPWKSVFRADQGNVPDSNQYDVAVQSFFEQEPRVFTASQKPLRTGREQLKMALKEYIAANPLKGAPLTAQDFVQPQVSDYQQAFKDVQQRISSGAIQKAVPVAFARKDFIPGEGLSASQKALWILSLLELPAQRLFLYGFWGDFGGTPEGVLGATPEVLFSLKDGRLTTMALAGTLPKSEVSSRLPLALDPKETHEHRLVVDDIVGRLKGLGSVQLGPLETIELPTLFHLRTVIELTQKPPPDILYPDVLDLAALSALLHPTPALGVSPRSAGYLWMREHPGQSDRGVFGAPIMFRLAADEEIALVAIRNIQWNSRGLQVGSGGGVVAESQLDREWTELQQKREAVFKSLGM